MTLHRRLPLISTVHFTLPWIVLSGAALFLVFFAARAFYAYIQPVPEMELGIDIPSQSDWVDYGTIFKQGEVGEWDYQLWGGFAGTAVKRNGTYYLYYQGASGYQLLPDETVTWRAIGVATSPDGVNFTKYAGNPVVTWFPTQDGEEGATSGGVTLDGNGNISLFYGANTAIGPTLVNADGRFATSTNGINFNDLGIALDHNDNSLWGSGDELFPVIGFRDNNQWFVYYIPNVLVNGRKLGVAWGNNWNNLNNSDRVSSGGNSITAWGMGGYAEVGPDVYALFINDVTVPKTEVRTISLNSPNQASAPIETYQFPEVTQATVILDEEANTWFMYYRGLDEYGLKLAPAGPPDTTPPTAPNNVSASPISDRQVILSWNPATDPQTGIVQYKVFRDGNLIATVKGWSYTDTGLVEQTEYDYEISAINYHGVEGSRSAVVQATTLVDTTPPKVVSVNAGANPNQVKVVFNEPVEAANAGNVSTYYAINGLDILNASISADFKTVTLMTTAQQDNNYLLTITGLHDRAQTPNPVSSPILMNYVFEGIDGLTGAWSFNQSDCFNAEQRPALLAIDTSNFGNDGILSPVQGGPNSVQGRIGSGLDFNGTNDHITINGAGTLENITDNSYTFAAWVRPDSVPPATNDNDTSYTILARDYTGLYYDADRKFRAEIRQNNGTSVSISSGAFNPNAWHHVVMTVDTGQKKLHLFVDGQEVSNSPASYSGSLVDHEEMPYFIGTSEPLTNRYEYRFNGLIDETRIYARALTSGEISTLFAWVPNNANALAYCTYLPAGFGK